MTTCGVLLRGVNVGGHNRVPLLHVGFCSSQPDVGGFVAAPPERLAVGDRALYLFHAGGVQRSGLARLRPGTDVTARNWRTVTALLELCC